MAESKTGKLILRSIPTKKAEEAVVAYLSGVFKKYPREKIIALIQKKPVTLSSDMPADKGTMIAARLRELGAIAVFVVGEEAREMTESSRTVEPFEDTKVLRIQKQSRGRRWIQGVAVFLVLVGAVIFGYTKFSGTKSAKQAQLKPHKKLQTPAPSRAKDTGFNPLRPISYKCPSIKEVDPRNMYAVFSYQYRMRPDVRFVEAFHVLTERYGQLYNYDPNASSFQVGTVRSDGDNIYIPLLKQGESLSETSLKLPLTFSDIKSGLSDWLNIMDEKQKIASLRLVQGLNRDDILQKAEQCINMVDARFAAVGLCLLEDLWQKGGKDAYILKTVAKAYSMLLMVLKPDKMGFSDAFASEALAFLALARHTDPGLPLAREEFLLAMNMGYRSHAESIIEKFSQTTFCEEDKILDAYMRQDLEGLRALCREYSGMLGHYLLSRHCREIGLHKEAEAAAGELLRRFPTLYPSLVENINSGPLNLAKILTILYPMDILRCIESQVSPESLKGLEPWIKRIRGFSGADVASDISFTRFTGMLANWSPYGDDSDYHFIIDTKRLKKIYSTLYANAVYARFYLLFKRWGVMEKAKTYVDSFAADDKSHPMILLMQGLVCAELGKQEEAYSLFSKVISHPEASHGLVYSAFNKIGDKLEKLRLLPLAADQLDGRPVNRLRMGWLCQKDIHNYDLAARYYESGLTQDPYQHWAYRYLSRVKGTSSPLLTALERSPHSFQLLKRAGEYFADKGDPKSLEKAAYIYSHAQELAPSKMSLARNHARMLRKLKHYNEALKVINTWLEQHGGSGLDTTITKGHRAHIYLEMEQPDRALTSLGKDAGSYQAGVMMSVAKAYEDLGQTSKAATQYQKALKRYPTVDHVIGGVAGFFWRQGEFELAAKMIVQGRLSQRPSSRWYFEDFMNALGKATDDRIYAAVKLLEHHGASSWELRALGWTLAKEQRNEVAFKILSNLKEPRMMLALENAVSVYKLLLQWKGKDEATEYLRETVPPNQKSALMIVLHKEGLFSTLLEEIGNPDDYAGRYREFMWLELLIAWLASDKEPMDLELKLKDHYQAKSSDYYHAIGRYLLGQTSLDDLLGMIRTAKHRCEFAYYIGLAARLEGDFSKATQWYHLCRETLLENNGEFHWASNELFYWAHMGLENRHRLVSDDIATYRARESARESYM